MKRNKKKCILVGNLATSRNGISYLWIKEEKETRINYLKKGKWFLEIKSKKENKLLKKGFIRYLKKINKI